MIFFQHNVHIQGWINWWFKHSALCRGNKTIPQTNDAVVNLCQCRSVNLVHVAMILELSNNWCNTKLVHSAELVQILLIVTSTWYICTVSRICCTRPPGFCDHNFVNTLLYSLFLPVMDNHLPFKNSLAGRRGSLKLLVYYCFALFLRLNGKLERNSTQYVDWWVLMNI